MSGLVMVMWQGLAHVQLLVISCCHSWLVWGVWNEGKVLAHSPLQADSCFLNPCQPPHLVLYQQSSLRWLTSPQCQHVGHWVLGLSVTGNCILMGTPSCISHSLAGDLFTTFATSSFRTWLRALLSSLLLPMRCCFTFWSFTPLIKTWATSIWMESSGDPTRAQWDSSWKLYCAAGSWLGGDTCRLPPSSGLWSLWTSCLKQNHQASPKYNAKTVTIQWRKVSVCLGP